MKKNKNCHRYVVAQLGARRHYAVPRIVGRAGQLECLYTDGMVAPWFRFLIQIFPPFVVPRMFRRMTGRLPLGLPQNKISTFPLLGLQYFFRRKRAKNALELNAAYLWMGKRFCKLVSSRGFGSATAVYGFNSAFLEIMHRAKKNGLICVLDQTIASQDCQDKLLKAEHSRWPGWQANPPSGTPYAELGRREKEEWNLADVIICGSTFVKESLTKVGVPAGKCEVVPSGISWSGKARSAALKLPSKENLKLLTIGTVGLRKGAPWLLTLANALKGSVEFRWVGSVEIESEARARMQERVKLMGSVPRIDMERHFEWADALILLSVCEGTAAVIYEALCRGIPVICTENSGPPFGNCPSLQVVPAGNINFALSAVRNLQRWKRRIGLPVVPYYIRRFVSFDSYAKRLLYVLGRRRLSL